MDSSVIKYPFFHDQNDVKIREQLAAGIAVPTVRSFELGTEGHSDAVCSA